MCFDKDPVLFKILNVVVDRVMDVDVVLLSLHLSTNNWSVEVFIVMFCVPDV